MTNFVPSELSQWSLGTINDLVKNSNFESDIFDFKEKLPEKGDLKGRLRLKKTVAAFANSNGGFLIFGVKDDKSLKEERLVGIEPEVDFPEHFGTYPSACEPSIQWKFKNPAIFLPNGRVIHICHILASNKKPHAVLDEFKFLFVKRTSKGNEFMSYTEVSRAYHDTDFFRTRLSLLIAELGVMKQAAQKLLDFSNGPADGKGTYHWAWATIYSTTLLDTTLADSYQTFTGDPKIWELLSSVRSSALHSNACCKAFSNIVFTAMENKRVITQQHYDSVRAEAQNIVEKSSNAIERLNGILEYFL